VEDRDVMYRDVRRLVAVVRQVRTPVVVSVREGLPAIGWEVARLRARALAMGRRRRFVEGVPQAGHPVPGSRGRPIASKGRGG